MLLKKSSSFSLNADHAPQLKAVVMQLSKIRITKLVIALTICALATSAFAQRKGGGAQSSDVRLSRNHATVYITFERFGKREPRRIGEGSDGVWLRLHNNTRWRLNLQAYDLKRVFVRGGEQEVGLYYEVGSIPGPASRVKEVGSTVVEEKRSCEAPLLTYGDLRSGIDLGPGKSVVFSVPFEHLCKICMWP
jgi:hypothetical protein